MKTCPINWKNEDGPYPCAFQYDCGECSYNPNGVGLNYYQKSCVPEHIERFKHDSKEITVLCGKCGNLCKTTVGEVEATKKFGESEYMCYECSDEKYGWSLAAHIRGDC